VVVVDDDHDVLTLLTTILSRQGYQVFQARSREECFSLVNREAPEVVLIDCMLPGMNGPEVIRLLRRMDENPQLIAVTGLGNERLAVQIMKAGALDYICKPFDNSEVLEAVETAFHAAASEGRSRPRNPAARGTSFACAGDEMDETEALRKRQKILHRQVEDMNRKVTEISTLHEVNKMLTSKLDLEDVLDTVMRLAGELFRAQAYSIRLLDQDGKLLHLAAHYGLSEEYLKRGPIAVGKSVAGAVVREGKPIYVPDAMNYHGLYKVSVARDEGLKSLFCFPLAIRGGCVGVMTFYHKQTHSYSLDETHFLSTFAGTVSIAVDNARLYQKQKRLAISDGLTGLYNHRYFHESLASEIKRAERYGNCLAVIILDIDHFKKYNDTFGHQAGDALLRELGELLSGVARLHDIVARYGGEEFVYRLHEANKSEAMLFAGRLRQRVAKHVFEGEGVLPGGKLTVSLGVASFPDDAATAQALIHAADMALYQAKDEGRNRVRAFQQAVQP
jgi:diguanylate cyclase (GGDEF)-like protein